MEFGGDPFDAVHADARKAWAAVAADAAAWRAARGADDGATSAAAAHADAVRARLRALDWDLQDLDEAVRVAAARPHAFGLTPDRVDARRRAVAELRDAARGVRADIDIDGGDESENVAVAAGENLPRPTGAQEGGCKSKGKSSAGFADGRNSLTTPTADDKGNDLRYMSTTLSAGDADRAALLLAGGKAVRANAHGGAGVSASLSASASGRVLPVARSAANAAMDNHRPNLATRKTHAGKPYFALDDQDAEQDTVVRDQDQSLDDLSKAVQRIGAMGMEMHEELQQHSTLLDDVQVSMDNTSTRMQTVHRKLDDFIAETSRGQLCSIVCLFFLFILLTFLVIAT